MRKEQTEGFLQFMTSHSDLNRTVKVTIAGLALLERETKGETGPGAMSQFIKDVGAGWQNEGIDDTAAACEQSRAKLCEMAIVQVFSAFDEYLTSAEAELSRSGVERPADRPAKTESTEERLSLTTILEWLGTTKELLATFDKLYDLFREARNCSAHRNGVCNAGLANLAKSKEVADALKKWNKDTNRKRPEIPAFKAGSEIKFDPRHAILASELCTKVVTLIDQQLIAVIGKDGLVRMAANVLQKSSFPNGIAFDAAHPPRSNIALFSFFLSGRYRVSGLSVETLPATLKRLDLFEEIQDSKKLRAIWEPRGAKKK